MKEEEFLGLYEGGRSEVYRLKGLYLRGL